MSRNLILFFTLLCFQAVGAEVSTTKPAGELDAATKYCLKNFPKGLSASQDGFEGCLRPAVEQYFQSVVRAAWGESTKTPAIAAASPAPAAAPAVDRAKEEARAKEQFKVLVKSARCQRCHVGLDASQFTLQQMQSVLITPSHQEHLSPKDMDLVRSLGKLFQ